MSELRAAARRIAARGHRGQTYNDGSYFEMHLERVAFTAESIAEKMKISEQEILDIIYCSALLHDYLEDCFDYSQTSLKAEHKTLAEKVGIPVANAVFILSRNTANSDEKYYKNTAENFITKVVKAADRITNILSLPDVKIKKKRVTLFEKYNTHLVYFEKYDIFPDLVKRALKEIEKILFS